MTTALLFGSPPEPGLSRRSRKSNPCGIEKTWYFRVENVPGMVAWNEGRSLALLLSQFIDDSCISPALYMGHRGQESRD